MVSSRILRGISGEAWNYFSRERSFLGEIKQYFPFVKQSLSFNSLGALFIPYKVTMRGWNLTV
jgi:hypothetical protein